MVIVIDNYDSFTYNLVQYLWELGAQVTVYRNDEKTVAQVMAEKPSHLLISPGPCSPSEAGRTSTQVAVVIVFSPIP